MKRIAFFLLIMMALQVSGQSKEDSLAIKKAAQDYVVGWSAGDVNRIQGAVSPELSKRRVAVNGELVFVQDMSRSLLCVSALANSKGVRMPDKTPGKELVQEVKILDIEGTNASVKTWNEKYGFFDYLHLSSAGGKWMIINVLWDMKSK
jgi:hypothetical protein